MQEQWLQRADRLADITQRVGFALWQLQELEGCAAQCFVLLAQAKQGMGVVAGEALVEKAQGKTFGATINQMAKASLLQPELAQRFSSLLAERNWLVHKSRADSRHVIHDHAATQALRGRLDAIADESLVLLKAIAKLAEDFVRRHGVSAEYIDRTAQQLLQQWQTSEAS